MGCKASIRGPRMQNAERRSATMRRRCISGDVLFQKWAPRRSEDSFCFKPNAGARSTHHTL